MVGMLREHRKLTLVDIDFDALELTAAEAESISVNNASARGNRNSEREYSPLNEAPGSGDKGESEEEEGFDFS